MILTGTNYTNINTRKIKMFFNIHDITNTIMVKRLRFAGSWKLITLHTQKIDSSNPALLHIHSHYTSKRDSVIVQIQIRNPYCTNNPMIMFYILCFFSATVRNLVALNKNKIQIQKQIICEIEPKVSIKFSYNEEYCDSCFWKVKRLNRSAKCIHVNPARVTRLDVSKSLSIAFLQKKRRNIFVCIIIMFFDEDIMYHRNFKVITFLKKSLETSLQYFLFTGTLK